MTIRGIFGIIGVFALAFFFTRPVPSAAQEERGKIYMHFFVVPLNFPDGAPAKDAISNTKEYLLTLAGGFTELGKSQGGWVNPQGMAERSKSVSFIVSAPRDISAELRQYISENFGVVAPYVTVWEAVEFSAG